MDGSTRLHTTGRWHASALCSSEADSGPHSSKELAFFFEALGNHLLQGLRRSMPNDDMHSAIGGRAGPGTCRLRSAPSAIQTWTHGGYGSVLSFLGSGIALLRKRRYGSPSTPRGGHPSASRLCWHSAHSQTLLTCEELGWSANYTKTSETGAYPAPYLPGTFFLPQHGTCTRFYI